MRISEPPRWIIQPDLLRPGSDAVLHMSRIEFEFDRPKLLITAGLIQTPNLIQPKLIH